MERYGTIAPASMKGEGMYTRAKGGRREDLGGIYFRSRWEANYARYLNFLVANGTIQSWEFEPKTFLFTGVTRGPFSYKPDFLVTENDGRKVWHEVKGWMDSKSKGKLDRMAKMYPEETIVVIASPEYKSIKKQMAGVIKEWECE